MVIHHSTIITSQEEKDVCSDFISNLVLCRPDFFYNSFRMTTAVIKPAEVNGPGGGVRWACLGGRQHHTKQTAAAPVTFGARRVIFRPTYAGDRRLSANESGG